MFKRFLFRLWYFFTSRKIRDTAPILVECFWSLQFFRKSFTFSQPGYYSASSTGLQITFISCLVTRISVFSGIYLTIVMKYLISGNWSDMSRCWRNWRRRIILRMRRIWCNVSRLDASPQTLPKRVKCENDIFTNTCFTTVHILSFGYVLSDNIFHLFPMQGLLFISCCIGYRSYRNIFYSNIFISCIFLYSLILFMNFRFSTTMKK